MKKVRSFIILLSVILSSCASSPLKKSNDYISYLDELAYKLGPKLSVADANKLLISRYDKTIKPYIKDLDRYDSETIERLFLATDIVVFQSSDRKYLAYEEALFAEIEKRGFAEKRVKVGMVTKSMAEGMFSGYISLGEFKKAKEIQNKYPKSIEETVPDVYDDESVMNKPFKLYRIVDDGKRLELVSFDINNGPKIVAVMSPGCHFSANAMNIISSSKYLRDIFGRYALIVLPGHTMSDFSKAAKWNKEQSELNYYTYINNETIKNDWKDFDFEATPHFYFLEDGVVKSYLEGIGPDFETDLKDGFSKIGISTSSI